MASTCSCIRCQNTGILCGHAVATIRHLKAMLQSTTCYLPAAGPKPTNPTWRRSIPSSKRLPSWARTRCIAGDNSGENKFDLDQDMYLRVVLLKREYKRATCGGEVTTYNPSNNGRCLPHIPNKPPPRCRTRKGLGHPASRCYYEILGGVNHG